MRMEKMPFHPAALALCTAIGFLSGSGSLAMRSDHPLHTIEMDTMQPAVSRVAFTWGELPPLPDRHGFAGGFAGVSNGALLFAGGANFPDGGAPWTGSKKVWSDRVHVLDRPDGEWRLVDRLPRSLGYGVSVTKDERVVCAGGSHEEGHSPSVFAISQRGGRVVFEKLPDLPEPLANSCGTLVGDILYVAGGTTSPTATSASGSFFSLDLSRAEARWERLPTWPGPARMLSVAGAHAGRFYLFSGVSLKPGADGSPQRSYLKDAYSFHPTEGWRRLSDMPRAAVAAASPAYSHADAGLVVFGGDDGSHAQEAASLKDDHPGFSSELLGYRPDSDAWSVLGRMNTFRRQDAPSNPNASVWAPVTLPFVQWGDALVFPSGEARPAVRTPRMLIAHPQIR